MDRVGTLVEIEATLDALLRPPVVLGETSKVDNRIKKLLKQRKELKELSDGFSK